MCEVETGTTFYSAKCGPNNSRVKSCKKATCEPVENQKQCLALFNSKSPANATEATASNDMAPIVRAPAAHASAGEVTDVSGQVKVIRVGGAAETPKPMFAVYTGDTVETKADGKIKIRLKDTSELILPPNSKMEIDNFEFDASADKRNVSLRLLMGKVRSRVNKKYEGANNFRVRTRAAVAGVRGTDFVTTFEPGAKEWKTEVITLEGKVQLGGGSSEKSPKFVEIPGGTYASFTVAAPERAPANDEETDALAMKGEVTPVLKLKDEQIDAAKDIEFAAASAKATKVSRVVASDSDEVCHEPAGRFNQCSFSCENNPSGEKKCRTDLPSVACVRKLCRANGVWSEQKRLPASEGAQCEPAKTVVRECGSYW